MENNYNTIVKTILCRIQLTHSKKYCPKIRNVHLRHEKEGKVKSFTHMTVFVDFLFTEMPNGKVLTFTS